jgi:hypothetical protein
MPSKSSAAPKRVVPTHLGREGASHHFIGYARVSSTDQIGYARVSSTDQDTATQEAKLKDAGCTIVHTEKVSARSRDGRSELEAVMAFIRPGMPWWWSSWTGLAAQHVTC